jgi:hypothetical protein
MNAAAVTTGAALSPGFRVPRVHPSLTLPAFLGPGLFS